MRLVDTVDAVHGGVRRLGVAVGERTCRSGALLGLALIVFLSDIAVFALQNTQVVSVRFLNAAVSAPFALLAVVIYALGMISGGSVVAFLRRSIRVVSTEPKPHAH